MQKRTLGKTGMNVTVLGFGAAEIGFQGVDQTTVEKLLGAALDAGLNVIDTAECYKNSEEMIGNAASHRRNDYFLFTKCGHTGASFDPPMADWDPKMLEHSIDRSLQRLKTDRVDLVQLHSCSEELLRKGDVINVVQKAKAAGKTRFIGYSGDSSAARFAIECGAFDTLQTSVSIADQEAIDLTLPLAVKNNIGVIAKRPVANATWQHKNGPTDSYQKPYWDRLQQLKYDFLNKPLQESIATALRFTLACPGVTTAIVGTTRPGRWKENAAMLGTGDVTSPEFDAIRARWKQVAAKDWTGQT
jgi:aryl-alcohol dehydrogenase-like predicted oxidoreductase